MIEYLYLQEELQVLVLGDKDMKKVIEFKNKIQESVIYKIVKAFIYLIVILLLIVIISQKVTNNKLALGGVRVFTVISGSMKGEYDIGDILIIKETEEKDLKVGDNITYLGKKNSLKNLVITHKLIRIEEKDGNKYYTTKGVANEVEDPSITYEQIYGKVIYKTVILSFLSRIMLNKVAYYLLFFVIGIMISIEIVSSYFKEEEDEENEGKE